MIKCTLFVDCRKKIDIPKPHSSKKININNSVFETIFKHKRQVDGNILKSITLLGEWFKSLIFLFFLLPYYG